MTTEDHYKQYKKEFKSLTDEELIELFNEEAGKQGWTSSRASFIAALHHEFNRRGFDYSAIGNSVSLSIKHKIKLVGKTIIVLSINYDDLADITKISLN